MTSSAETMAVHDTEAQLRELVERGFRFVHPTDAEGELAAIVGVRVHGSVVDVVKLHDEGDVVATRMPGDETDILSPRHVLWQTTGYVGDVLANLLSLPDELEPGEGTGEEASGCWVPVRPGSAKWISAAN